MPPKLLKKSGSKQVLKNCLQEPYNLTWPQLEKGANSYILNELKRFFQEHPELKKKKSAGKRKRKKTEENDKPSIRKNIFTGINVITKKLEQGKLDLVLVCKSAKPTILIQHLIPLCATRYTVAGCIAGLSESVGSLLNLKSVLAIGFVLPEGGKDLKDLASKISLKLPQLSVPWLCGKNIDKSKVEDSDDGNGISEPNLKGIDSVQKITLQPARICINQSISNKKPKKDF